MSALEAAVVSLLMLLTGTSGGLLAIGLRRREPAGAPPAEATVGTGSAAGSAAASASASVLTRAAATDSVSQDFLRTVYHELRSPVSSVAALARACGKLDQLDPAGRDEALELIQRHAEQLSAILDDVREVAECLGVQQTALSTCSLQEVVRTSAACAGLPSERLTIDLAADARFLSTSASALARILTNLLQNAARYGPADGPVLVRSRRCDRSRRTEVSVLDSGAGPGAGPGAGAPTSPAEALGIGSRIVDELAASLGGAVLRQRTPLGYAVVVRLPDGLVGPG